MQPKGDQQQAFYDYKAGMKYRDIAIKHGISINTVKSWCLRYNWKEQRMAAKSQHLFIKRLRKGLHNKGA